MPDTPTVPLPALATDPDARATLTAAIAACPFEAVFWECAPLARGRAASAFVLVDAPALTRMTPDARAFAAELAGAGPVATFRNLSGDAELVVPNPTAVPRSAGGHLARFVRDAPAAVVDELWVAVGQAVASWLARTSDPVWVSTSGLGVPWLHVRLDRRPKYYTHTPFRTVQPDAATTTTTRTP